MTSIAMTKPNEPEALEPCPFCGEADYLTVPESHAAGMTWWQVECGCGAFAPTGNAKAEAIAAWNRRAPAHPVADAGGVTDADREAAAKCVEHGLSRPNPLNVRQGVVDSWHLVKAFAAHRLQSVAAATAATDAEIARLKGQFSRCFHEAANAQEEVARLREGIERALCCTPSIQSERSQFHGIGETHKIVYDCGNPWEILRAALSEAREAGE